MIYFFVYLLFEILVSVEVSSMIGGFYTFLEVIGSAILGIFIISNYQNIMLSNVRDFFSGKTNDQEFIESNLFPFIGAILLIVPGFLTDFIGLFLQMNILTSVFFNFFMTQPRVTMDITAEEQKDYYKSQKSDREFSVHFSQNSSARKKSETEINTSNSNTKDFIDAEIIEPKSKKDSDSSNN